jgi:hypothetical protein
MEKGKIQVVTQGCHSSECAGPPPQSDDGNTIHFSHFDLQGGDRTNPVGEGFPDFPAAN